MYCTFLVGLLFVINGPSHTNGQQKSSINITLAGCSGKHGQQKITPPTALYFNFKNASKADINNKVTCRWSVEVPCDHVLLLKFRNLSSSPNNKSLWNHDWLDVYDSLYETGKINWRCNVHDKPNFLSSGRNMVIKYEHYPTSNGKENKLQNFEFTAELEKIPINDARCPPSIVKKLDSKINQTNHIMSRNFPNYSRLDQFCTWLITSPEQHVVHLRFSHFTIDDSLGCDKSYFEARDGEKSDSPVLVKQCGSDYRCPIVSSGRHMWIRYKTEGTKMNAFRAAYTAVDQEDAHPVTVLNNSNTEFSVSITKEQLERKDNINCTWAFELAKGRHLNVTLTPTAKQERFQERLEVTGGKSFEESFQESLSRENVLMSSSKINETFRTFNKEIYLTFRLFPNLKGKSRIFKIQLKTWIPVKIEMKEKPTTTTNATTTTTAMSTVLTNLLSTTTATQAVTEASVDDFPKETKISTWTIWGVTFIGTAAALLLFFLCIFCIRKKLKARAYKRKRDDWEIQSSKVVLLEELGEGAFGKVWKGYVCRKDLLNKTIPTEAGGKRVFRKTSKQSMVVAVKTPHSGVGEKCTEEVKNELLLEIEFMKTVGYHKNIICMLACCTLEENVLLVVEYAENGDLLTFLRNTRKKMATRNSSETKYDILEDQVSAASQDNTDEGFPIEKLQSDFISFSWQIAKGMEYLSAKRIIHRDLAARNILLATDNLVKVADFGLSRQTTYKYQIYQAQERRKLPIKWMAPECIFEETFTAKSDVWSYGIVLWEIYSLGGAPYPTISNAQLPNQLRKGYRMEKPDLCPDDMYEVMMNCWKGQVEERPTFTDVIQTVETLMTRDNPYIEFTGIDESKECYLVPSFNSAPDDSEDEDETLV